MRYTNDATELPTENALRLAARTRDTVRRYVARSIVLLVAIGTFAAGTTATALTLSAAVAVLPAHPLTLLATTATAFVALYAVPLLTLFTTRFALRELEW